MATWKIVGNSTGEMTSSLGGEEWRSAIETAKERLEMRSRQVGADPLSIEKAEILNAALNLSIHGIFQAGIDELGLTPVSEAVIDVPEITSEEVTVCFRFSVMPEFELGDLSSLKYEVEHVEVTNADIDAEITQLKNSIESQGEKIPSDNDEFARGFGIEGVESLEDLKGSINDALIKSRTADAAVRAENRLLDDLCDLVKFDAPDGMVDMEVESLIAADKDKVASMNGDWDEFLKAARKTEEMLRDEYRPDAARNIKIRLILERIASENDLNPSAEEIETEYASLAGAYGVPVEDFKSALPESDIIYQKRLVMAMDHLKK